MLEIPLGSFTLPIHGFGVLVALGFMVGSNVAMKRASRFQMDPDVINRLVGWLIVGTFIGGHVGYGLMYEPAEYLAHPIKFLQVWQGLSSFGGFMVCVPLAIWFFYKEKVNVWAYLDSLAHGMAIGWFLGRMGCFVAHDHPGTPADNFFLGVYCRPVEGHMIHLPDWLTAGHGGPWGPCRDFPHVMAAHDMGLYEALWSLAMFGVLIAMDRMRTWKAGIQVLVFGLTYGPVRFAMDALRPVSTDVRYAGLTPGQWSSLALTLICLAFLAQRLRADDAPIERTPSAE